MARKRNAIKARRAEDGRLKRNKDANFARILRRLDAQRAFYSLTSVGRVQ